MLPRALRLTKHFSVVFQKGVSYKTPFFLCKALPARDERHRLAVVVSKKTAKKAVDRNAIRRRLLAAVCALGYPEPLFSPWRMVLVGRREVLTADWGQLLRAVEQSYNALNAQKLPKSPLPSGASA